MAHQPFSMPDRPCYSAGMARYLLSLKSDRSTFTTALDAADDDGAIERAADLVRKARAPVGAKVKIVRADHTELDVSEAMMRYLDRPAF